MLCSSAPQVDLLADALKPGRAAAACGRAVADGHPVAQLEGLHRKQEEACAAISDSASVRGHRVWDDPLSRTRDCREYVIAVSHALSSRIPFPCRSSVKACQGRCAIVLHQSQVHAFS